LRFAPLDSLTAAGYLNVKNHGDSAMIKFRKSIKIAKGVKVNLTTKGISSVSLGGNGATVNLGKDGAKATVGLPGTGLSHTQNLTSNSRKSLNPQSNETPSEAKKVSLFLGLGILIMPYIFSWLLFRKGYSFFARFVSFSWLTIFIYTITNNF
jgi:ATP-dependent Zn protease